MPGFLMVFSGLFLVPLIPDRIFFNVEFIRINIGIRRWIRRVVLFYFSFKLPFILYISHNSRLFMIRFNILNDIAGCR